MRLPVAYRSLPRPSSPAAAKASAMRPYSLGAKSMAPGAGGPGEPGRFCPCFRGAHSVGAPRGSVASWKSVFTFRARPLLSGARARGRLPKRPPGDGRADFRAAPGIQGVGSGGMVGAHGLGPWTSSLSETRSNQLSYAPAFPPARGASPGNGTAQCNVPYLARLRGRRGDPPRRAGACSLERR